MRTKTLLIASAALAVGILTSSAQTYSQNIVGYVTLQAPAGYTVWNVPLNGNTDNALNDVIANDGSFDGNQLLLWSGTKFVTLTFDSGMPQGFANALDNASVPAPVVNPGTAFLIDNNQGGGTFVNVFTGSVAVNTLPGTTTNNIPAGIGFYASILPISGGVNTVLGMPNTGANLGQMDGNPILQPNIVGGAFRGYITETFDSGFPSGFGNALDNGSAPEPVIPVGGGFLINNNQGGGTYQWIQTLTP